MHVAPVTTKRQNYQLLASGAYGNQFRNWRTLEEFKASGYQGLTVIRTLTPNSPWCIYNVPAAEIAAKVEEIVEQGAPRALLTFNEQMPKDSIALQGELTDDPNTYLYYSTVPEHMRVALAKHGLHAYGLQVKLLLQAALSAASYADLEALQNLYPGHVIEFSAFNKFVGNLPGRNAVVWEVRRY